MKFEGVDVNLVLEEVMMVVESEGVLKGVWIEKKVCAWVGKMEGIGNEVKEVLVHIFKKGIEVMDGVSVV
uniref:hypothetical protein n=1 Tax=Bacillus pumilus TaxID=1408 RepID=UPI001C92E0D6